MLESTFCHIPGVGELTERSLWQAGCLTWSDFLASPASFDTGAAPRAKFEEVVRASQLSLEKGEHQHFRGSLGLKEAWRAYPSFEHSCAYLDIETDGGNSGDAVTLIGLYDGESFQAFIKGESLESFRDVISRYSMIVTFFGSGFDLPMLQKCFQGIVFDQIHIDLCPTLRRLGLRGGLKRIEAQLNLSRTEETRGLNGLDAIRLWRRFSREDDIQALSTLVAYNREDVVNLKALAHYAYPRLREAAMGIELSREAERRLQPLR